MNVARSVAELEGALAEHRRAGATIGFVATMGALHEGHLSLVRAARSADDVVVVSIFVNPLQFAPNEDYASYPRDETRDLALAEEEKVDLVFVPSGEEMYPGGASTVVDVGPLGNIVEGEMRPGHFRGVATIVAKLFHLVQPTRAYFGQKDAQQVAVIKRMVTDLWFPVEIVVCPTVRDGDGLALSSRNAYLSEEERRTATTLWRALVAGREAWEREGRPDAAEAAMRALLAEQPLDLDYARAVDPNTFGAPDAGCALLVVAARVGRTRLIDNLLVP